MAVPRVNYVSDDFDKIALAATPTLMQPLKGQISWPLVEGAYRYIMARDGLYIEGKSALLHACFKVNDLNGKTMPYGELRAFCDLKFGLIPDEIRRELIGRCLQSAETEYAALITCDDGKYKIVQPETVSKSASHISYKNDGQLNQVLVDVHSHGFGRAYFSSTDDQSDQNGIYIAMVVGCCNDMTTINVKSRIVIHGNFCDIKWEPFEGEQ